MILSPLFTSVYYINDKVFLLLLIRPDSYLYIRVAEQLCHLGDRRVAIVIWKQHFGADAPRRTCRLLGRHGVRLVGGQKRNVYGSQTAHFINVFGISGNIDAQSVDGKHIAVVPTLGMIQQMSGRDIVCRHSPQHHAGFKLQTVTVVHHHAPPQDFRTVLIGDEQRGALLQIGNGRLVEMVAMLMGYQNIIGLG